MWGRVRSPRAAKGQAAASSPKKAARRSAGAVPDLAFKHSHLDAWFAVVVKRERTVHEFVRKTQEDLAHRFFLAWKATLPEWLKHHAEVDAFFHKVASRHNAHIISNRSRSRC